MDATTIIDAFGGYTKLAESLGIGRTGVFNWIKSGIPPGRCVQLADLAEQRGLHKGFKDKNGLKQPGITLRVLMQSKPRVSGPVNDTTSGLQAAER